MTGERNVSGRQGVGFLLSPPDSGTAGDRLRPWRTSPGSAPAEGGLEAPALLALNTMTAVRILEGVQLEGVHRPA